MTESIHGYVVEQLQKCKGQWPRVARDTGVPVRSIEKIARMEWKDPGVTTVETLALYFRKPTRSRNANNAA